jgi:hypothetical protein
MVIAARSEYEDQAAVFQWAAINEHRWPCLKLLYGSLMGIHVPIKLLNKAKKAGMKKGKPDISLPVPMGGYCGLWIELKRLGGKNPTKEQVKNLTLLGLVGNAAYACHGSDAAIEVLESYLAGRIRRSQPPYTQQWDPTKPLNF